MKVVFKNVLGALLLPIIIAEQIAKFYSPSEYIGFNPWRQIIKEKPRTKIKFYS